MISEELMQRLQAFLSKEENGGLKGIPATEAQIDAAEQELGVKFHDDYRQFIRTFGGAYAGLAIHAFQNGSSIGRETVVELTHSFRQQLAEYPELAATMAEGYVISLDGSGDPIYIHRDGDVRILYHDSGETERLAGSFGELIEDSFFEW